MVARTLAIQGFIASAMWLLALLLAGVLVPSAVRAADNVVVKAGEDGFALQSTDRAFALRLRGVMQLDSRFFLEDRDKQNLDTFYGRRVQPTLEGSVHDRYDFRLTYDLVDGRASLLDAYLNLRPNPTLQVRFGKSKAPVGLERLQSSTDTRFVELAYPSSVAPNRDFGILIHGAAGVRVSYAVGVMNGAPDGGSLDADVNDGKDAVARVLLTPFAQTEGSLFRGLGLGVAGTWGDQSGALSSYRSPGRATVISFATGVTADDRRTRIQPQAHYFLGPLGVLAEYANSEQTGKLAGEKTTFRSEGWMAAATYLLTGEAASFKSITPARSFDFTGGPGAIELAARFHALAIDPIVFAKALSDPTRSVRRAATWGGGLNWYWNKNARFTADYELTEFRRGASGGTNRRTERVVQTRFQVGF